jgi:pimeloyl-ACP methyl ester carboxylesterase
MLRVSRSRKPPTAREETASREPPVGCIDQTLMDAHRTVVGGARVTYGRAGDGPPLVLLHGDGETHRGWRAVAPRLAERWDVVAPDLPGFGESEGVGDMAPERLADWLGEFLEQIAIGPAPLVGSSLGGLVAVNHALASPDRVPALVLVDAAGLGAAFNPLLGASALPGLGELAIVASALPLSGHARAHGRRLLLFADPRRAPEWWLDDMREASRPSVVATSMASRRATLAPWGQRRIVLERLRMMAQPTLVVWGRDDYIFPVSQARNAVDRLPAGRLAVIPECGHLPPVERPEAFLAEVVPFLSGV